MEYQPDFQLSELSQLELEFSLEFCCLGSGSAINYGIIIYVLGTYRCRIIDPNYNEVAFGDFLSPFYHKPEDMDKLKPLEEVHK